MIKLPDFVYVDGNMLTKVQKGAQDYVNENFEKWKNNIYDKYDYIIPEEDRKKLIDYVDESINNFYKDIYACKETRDLPPYVYAKVSDEIDRDVKIWLKSAKDKESSEHKMTRAIDALENIADSCNTIGINSGDINKSLESVKNELRNINSTVANKDFGSDITAKKIYIRR